MVAALAAPRSRILDFAHANATVRDILTGLPEALRSEPKAGGLLVFSPDAERLLYATMHDGSAVRRIVAAVPDGETLILASLAGGPLARVANPCRGGACGAGVPRTGAP